MRYILSILVLCVAPLFAKEERDRIYLGWYNSPVTSMTVQWITRNDKPQDTVAFRPLALGPEEKSAWTLVDGSHELLPDSENYLLHRVDITALAPDTIYEFRFKGEPAIYKFRTCPERLEAPLRFAVGGDVYRKNIEPVRAMCRAVAKTNPRFALIGGDIAYAAKKTPDTVENFSKWLDFFACWTDEMKDQDGCLIPLFTAIGNHEVKGRYDHNPENAPLYYAFFHRGYYDYGFGSYAHFTFLDSGHTHKIGGSQTVWLDRVLNYNKKFTHRFAIYHVGAYPSSGKFDCHISREVREHWVPLFEKYCLSACFENHDHAYKRTHPLLHDVPNKNGVVYFGDGSWGVNPRPPEDRPYLAHKAQTQQALIVELSNEDRKYWAIDPESNLIDYYVQQVK